ncbi:hypothetical protein CVT26_001814 [Gymnopilus dilepis]|uniref:ATP-dependent DNA helicase n=1 Tax=Gymnopilus dilepis TaxID=231916 RepID=A0A409WAW1_9AGAR|nr:hypothetical protein CVT26_001814 [Gymnopilus dilepis]
MASNPCWFWFSDAHYLSSLSSLPSEALRMSAVLLDLKPRKSATKATLCNILLAKFLAERAHVAVLSTAELRARIPAPDLTLNHSALVASYFDTLFGNIVGPAFRIPENFPPSTTSSANSRDVLETLLAVSSAPTFRLKPSRLLTTRILRDVLDKLHSSRRPPFSRSSFNSCADAIIYSFRSRAKNLARASVAQLLDVIHCWDPSFSPSRSLSLFDAIVAILRFEYTPDLFSYLTSTAVARVSAHRQEGRKITRQRAMLSLLDREKTIIENWPTLPSDEVLYQCMANYRAGTVYTIPHPCACCTRARHGVKDHVFLLDRNAPSLVEELNLSILVPSDPAAAHVPFPACPVSCLSNFMLHPCGLTYDDTTSFFSLHLCHDCLTSLKAARLPRFALANNLFRGELPDRFKDLTWVEEMACAVHRTTAHVSRIYQSSDPAQPRVFHGNTCAHDMNIVSTAEVLPRTPDNVNGMLSVVFIGPGKYKADCLKHMFSVRKAKIWDFLYWLKYEARNPLYQSVVLDKRNIDLYPENDTLPGVADRVLHDQSLSVAKTFAEESAGLDDHPALQVQAADDDCDEPLLFLEKFGVSDPEGVKIQGRTFTAAALRNVIVNPSDQPDLIIHRSSRPVDEYKNPKLFPGLYPTLFPYGIGGFEDPTRRLSLSFQKQANYYLDIHDRSFRYHHSFIFVAVNILQRRAAHLHTHLTVSSQRFNAVADRLVSISPETLASVADHLEKEGSFSDLSSEQKQAFDLLKEVNTVAAKIPGSHASKVLSRNNIRSFSGLFCIPPLYFTVNTNAAHSPIFQVVFGDYTVDLNDRFPVLVSSTERALRLAKDPVAAADFFEFSVKCLFQYLFGWDFELERSTEMGGILGHLRAFYGVREVTGRGQFHIHFVLWLVGALNPSDLHEKLKSCPGFDKKVFDFFEGIIKHHLPSVDVLVDKKYEPRAERPPFAPPPPNERDGFDLEAWIKEFNIEHKKLGEKLQRHVCRPVCHKYGNTNSCRFQFPHEIISQSSFDPETNSLYLLCLDGEVNYHNPIILVYCRHNHDLKCILSGKAAKAAMFYITDYITKMDLKTYQFLSLMSRAVVSARLYSGDEDTKPASDAKTLLQKCLSQFLKQQELHAQQAVNYIRGNTDSFASHKTVPILSSLLLYFVKDRFFPCDSHSSQNFTLDDSDDVEAPRLRITVDEDGRLSRRTQVDDYFYRDVALQDVNFFDFVQNFRVEKIKDISATIAGTVPLKAYSRYCLQAPHPCWDTHCIVKHTDHSQGHVLHTLVPRVVGLSIPRKGSANYAAFMLAHFKPFSCALPLLEAGQSIEQAFLSFTFGDKANMIMHNWEALNECEDARDAERLKKREALTRESLSLTKAMAPNFDDIFELEAEDDDCMSQRDFEVNATLLKLIGCNWLKRAKPCNNALPIPTLENSINIPDINRQMVKAWKVQMKAQEKLRIATRRNLTDPLNQMSASIPDTETLRDTEIAPPQPAQPVEHLTPSIKDTELGSHTEKPAESVEQLIERVITEEQLNRKQTMAFRIIVRAFLQMMQDDVSGVNKPTDPHFKKYLSLLLTGPGGTGKTHVVKAVQRVMDAYGYGHRIRFMAPSGSAAALIGGMTIHKGLFIKVMKTHKGKSNREPGESEEYYHINLTPDNKRQIREDFKDVWILLIDEVSLLSQELLAQVDHALRYAKNNNEFFGGIIVIFSGDFCQYPPVGGRPLYSPIRNNTSMSETEFLARLGRIVWRSVDDVICLEEQHRMKSDPEYAAAVLRLRRRQCTLADVDLFNSRVIKSVDKPEGIDMGLPSNQGAVAIVSTNLVRQAINMTKSTTVCSSMGKELVTCAALDVTGKEPIPKASRDLLLKKDLSRYSKDALPGFIPLYEGMPIILRNKNISTELGIVNGSQGFLRKLVTSICPAGYTYATCAIVEVPNCNVQLENLPPKHFPIEPITWSFSTKLPLDPEHPERLTQCKVTRSQLPLQPGFSFTGHAAQGGTIPLNISSLAEGGFAAYVAASRARSREGIAILEPVTLQDLNRKLPPALELEEHRHSIMEYNTMLKYGFIKGEPKVVPDPEGDMKDVLKIGKPVFSETSDRKRKRKTEEGDNEEAQLTKRRKSTPHLPDRQLAPPQPFRGIIWSNNSCGYDATYMVFYSIWQENRILWSERLLTAENEHWQFLARTFATQRSHEDVRDEWIQYLHECNPQAFRRGDFVDLGNLLGVLGSSPNNVCRVSNYVCRYHPEQIGTYEAISHTTSFIVLHNLPFVSVQDWITAGLEEKTGRRCHECNKRMAMKSQFLALPEVLIFDVSFRVDIGIDTELRIEHLGTYHGYMLKGVIYFGDNHFCVRLLTSDNNVWFHDGISTHSNLVWEGTSDSMAWSHCRNKTVSALIYTKT